jgi:uncharacterized membrane protein YfcA
MMDTPYVLAVVTATFLLAGLIKGVIGLGLPTVSVGLLALALPPAEAAALLVVPSLVTNIWQLAAGPALRPLARRLWPMLAGICVGTLAAAALGAGLVAGEAAGHAGAALGLALAAYGLLGLFDRPLRVSVKTEGWLGPVAGVANGAITAATGVFVLPSVPYLQALRLPRDDLVQALGLSFTVSTLALGAVLLGDGLFAPSLAGTSLLAVVPALVGMSLGQRWRAGIEPRVFRLCFFLGLTGLGLHLALRGLP